LETDTALAVEDPSSALAARGLRKGDVIAIYSPNLPEYAALSVRAQAVRRLGSAVLDLCYVASGRLDAFWELSLGPWDMAAGGLIVLEAGGRVTNVLGGPWRLQGPGVLASNGHIHEAVLEGLAATRGGRP